MQLLLLSLSSITENSFTCLPTGWYLHVSHIRRVLYLFWNQISINVVSCGMHLESVYFFTMHFLYLITCTPSLFLTSRTQNCIRTRTIKLLFHSEADLNEVLYMYISFTLQINSFQQSSILMPYFQFTYSKIRDACMWKYYCWQHATAASSSAINCQRLDHPVDTLPKRDTVFSDYLTALVYSCLGICSLVNPCLKGTKWHPWIANLCFKGIKLHPQIRCAAATPFLPSAATPFLPDCS